MRQVLRRIARSAAAAGLLALPLAGLQPSAASAHPLGNFTINHYAEVRVGVRRIQLDVVIDMAEIPTFSERPLLDTNHDGAIDAAELSGARVARCTGLAGTLALRVDGASVGLRLTAAGLVLLPGAGGLQTIRTVCEFEADNASSAGSHVVSFQDDSYPDRIGWREIVATGDALTVKASAAETATISARLTRYPTNLIVQPPNERGVTIAATPGGRALGALTAPDAQPITAGVVAPAAASGLAGAVPGGVGGELSGLIGARDLTPFVVVLSMLIAAGLGAVHAVSPGHGKTIMAAYLVGNQGRPRHAIGLALAVTVSHTLGVVALAGVTLIASNLIPPERLYPVLGVASGLSVAAIGSWLLLARWRQLMLARAHHAPAHGHHHPHQHEQVQRHEPGRPHQAAHRHGPFRHRHDAEPAASLSWRSLLAIGVAGGLVPSASALILMLGAVAAGRPAFGIALAVAFGIGMAVVLGAIGLFLGYAGRRIQQVPVMARLSWLAPIVPWVTGAVVLGGGIALIGQALVQRF